MIKILARCVIGPGMRRRRRIRRQIRKQRFPFFSIVALGLFAIAFSLGTALWKQLPDVTPLLSAYPVSVTNLEKNGPASMRLQKERPKHWVSLSEVSRRATGAVIVSEDWAFFSHGGYDTNQIFEVAKDAWNTGRVTRGASTITQQVVRNVFLGRERTAWRKVKELVLAVRLEAALSKSRILEIYLNIAEWGDGIRGIGSASAKYFDKHPSQLGAKEGAFLAMLLPSPKRYAQSFKNRKLTPYAERTIESILDKMVQAGYLDAEEKTYESHAPLPFEDIPEALDSAEPTEHGETESDSLDSET